MPAPLRVLQLGKYYPPYRGGMETHLQALVRHLKDKVALTVLVASTERRTRTDHDHGVAITRVGTPLRLSAAPLSPALPLLVRRARPQVVHLHWPNPMAYLAWKLAGSPGVLVVTYHSDIVRQKRLARFYRPVLDAMLREAVAIVVLAARSYAETSTSLAPYLGKVHAIPHGLELERFAEADPAQLAALHVRYPGPVLLAVGRLVYYKGFDVLLDALAALPGVTLLIVGTGPLKAELLAQAERLGIAGRVHFLEGIGEAELPAYYHRADVFVLPSVERSESFGMVQVEAMAAGTPVVNTAIDSGVPEVSPHEVTGLTVPPRDAAALTAAVRRLLDDPALASRLGAAGRLRASQEYSAQALAERTAALYLALPTTPSRAGAVGPG